MYKLFPYQKELVNKARNSLRQNKSVLIQSPAGSGKSIVIAEIARLTTAKGNRVMFTVHRQELIDQITNSFKKQDVNLDLCTIMTVRKIKNRLKILPKPQLIITDETHHSLAKTYKAIYDYYPDVPRLGFTATPWRMSGEPLHKVYQNMVLGKSVKWLLKYQFLAPFHYWAVDSVDHGKLKASNKSSDYTNDSIDQSFGKNIFGDVVEKYQKYADGQKTIVYAHSIDYSKKIADKFCKAGIKAVHVDSKTPKKERQQIMQAFKTGKIKVLCNIDLISEGFDVPDCSCVIMVRPTKSLVLFIQQAMRCMRSDHQGPKGTNAKKVATIIDMVGNAEQHKGLPDTNFDWYATFMGHSAGGQSPTDCQYCFASFFPAASNKYKRVVMEHDDDTSDDEATEMQRWSNSTPNDVIWKWINQHQIGKIPLLPENVTVCPVCHHIAKASVIEQQARKNDKNLVANAKFIDISDPNNRHLWELQKTAKRSTKKLKTPKSIYAVFDARKKLDPTSTKKPLFQTLFVLMKNADDHHLTDKKLDQLANVSNQSFEEIQSAYVWAQRHWDFPEPPHYQFNF